MNLKLLLVDQKSCKQ